MRPQRWARTEAYLDLVKEELERAWVKFPRPQASAHEGWAVLREEVDEMWDAIKGNDVEHAKKEAVQVAAMAIRFLVES